MQTIPEEQRLAALDSYNILDTPPEQVYDDLTELASFICGTPISLVSLVGENHQFFKAAHNLPITGTPREQSFCAHTIPTAKTLIVEDARQDERFAENPLVTGYPNIRFYAGAPIIDSGGHVLGALCVVDHQPRKLGHRQVIALEALARHANELIEQRRFSREALSKTDLQLQLAVEAGNLGLYTWRVGSDRAVWENGRMYQVLGRSVAQGPISAAEFVHQVVLPEDRNSYTSAVSAIEKQGDRLQWTGRFKAGDGTVRWVEFLGLTDTSPDGSLMLYGTAADVTETRQREWEQVLAAEPV